MDALYPAGASALARRPGSSTALAEKLLNFVLFITMLLSCLAFIEPSPHDAMMLVLLVACVAARVPFDRRLTPLLVLMVLWLVGGAMSLIKVAGTEELHPIANQNAIQYFATSVYLGVAAIMFACLFSDGDLVRLRILHRAYLIAAVCATIVGCLAFFHLVPHWDMFLALSEDLLSARVKATFKDPNVYGPFIIFPLLMLTLRMLTEKITLVAVMLALILLTGLLLSFSRGAWMHFVLSAVVAIAIAFLSAPNTKARGRIVALMLISAIALAIFVAILLSIGSIHDMFLERAKPFQPYDTAGSGGRFSLQELALGDILEFPNGMGPYGFSNATIGGQQHNVYLQAFLVYGWLGGATYLAIVLTTLMIGFRNAFLRTPWQLYLIAAYASYIGEIGEGSIIDTDHWRHFFLVLGLVWGLSVATMNYRRALVRADTAAFY
jgi:hypothetical protein